MRILGNHLEDIAQLYSLLPTPRFTRTNWKGKWELSIPIIIISLYGKKKKKHFLEQLQKSVE